VKRGVETIEECGRQLELSFSSPEVDLDGRIDPKRPYVRYIGRAHKDWASGKWRCLAEVESALCVVEVRLTPEPT
jgi:hypothetical protein